MANDGEPTETHGFTKSPAGWWSRTALGQRMNEILDAVDTIVSGISSDGTSLSFAHGTFTDSVTDPSGTTHTARVLAAAGETTVDTPGFDTWSQPAPSNPAVLFIDFVVSGSGTTTGEVAIDVDESGGTTADYSYTFTVGTGLTGSITTSEQATVYLPAGAQYQIRNVADPNGNHAIHSIRVASL